MSQPVPKPVPAAPAGPRPKHRRVLWLVVLAAAVIFVGGGLWLALVPDSTNTASPAKPGDGGRRRVAQTWRWGPQAEQAVAKSTAAMGPTGRIHPDDVAKALARVPLDAGGNVVIDTETRNVLEESFRKLPQDLSPEEMQALLAIIRAGLPGPAGEQAAKIVGDYHRYRTAVNALEAAGTAATPEAQRARLQRLIALQREHLGPLVATKFYAEDHAFQRFMLERERMQRAGEESVAQQLALRRELENGVFFLEARNSPAARELNQQMDMLRAQGASDEHLRYVQAQSLGLAAAADLARTDAERRDFEQRYAQFREERYYVLTAGLTEEDKRAQIEALLQQRFSAAELQLIRAFDGE